MVDFVDLLDQIIRYIIWDKVKRSDYDCQKIGKSTSSPIGTRLNGHRGLGPKESKYVILQPNLLNYKGPRFSHYLDTSAHVHLGELRSI